MNESRQSARPRCIVDLLNNTNNIIIAQFKVGIDWLLFELFLYLNCNAADLLPAWGLDVAIDTAVSFNYSFRSSSESLRLATRQVNAAIACRTRWERRWASGRCCPTRRTRIQALNEPMSRSSHFTLPLQSRSCWTYAWAGS